MTVLTTLEGPTGSKLVVEVATGDELLAFANSVRRAAGATELSRLTCSRRNNPFECLIANAVNFSSSVIPRRDQYGTTLLWPSQAAQWVMTPEDSSIIQRIVDAVEDTWLVDNYDWLGGSLVTQPAVLLPEAIGNAAVAFDYGVAFTELALQEG